MADKTVDQVEKTEQRLYGLWKNPTTEPSQRT